MGRVLVGGGLSLPKRFSLALPGLVQIWLGVRVQFVRIGHGAGKNQKRDRRLSAPAPWLPGIRRLSHRHICGRKSNVSRRLLALLQVAVAGREMNVGLVVEPQGRQLFLGKTSEKVRSAVDSRFTRPTWAIRAILRGDPTWGLRLKLSQKPVDTFLAVTFLAVGRHIAMGVAKSVLEYP